jgi:hypothetical protein
MHLEKSDRPVANDTAAPTGATALPANAAGRVVSLDAFRRRRRRARPVAPRPDGSLLGEILVECRNYMVGRDDWNRGLRALFRTYSQPMTASLGADGCLRLYDFPLGDLVLSAEELSRAGTEGLHFRAADFEADVGAEAIRALLRSGAGRFRPRLISSR